MADIQYMDVRAFRREGYLQEVNRRFLHPLGLALEVVVDPEGSERLGGVWDYRADPEGMRFNEFGADDEQKAAAIESEWESRRATREAALGYMVQPATPGNSTSASSGEEP